MGQNFTPSVDRLLTLRPRYLMVTYLTHGDGVEGGGGVGRRMWGWGGGGVVR